MRQKSFHTLNELTKFCQLRGATSSSTMAAAARAAPASPLVQHYATIDGKQVSHPTAMMVTMMMMMISKPPLSLTHPPTCGPIVDGHEIGCLIEWTIGQWREQAGWVEEWVLYKML